VVVVVVVMMTMRHDADVNPSAVMVMVVVMMMSDNDLSCPGSAALRQTLIVGFQQRQGVRDWIEKVAITGSRWEPRLACRRRLGSGHRGEGCGRSQQASQFLVHSSSSANFALHAARGNKSLGGSKFPRSLE
jgi:hypothetical protein